MNQHSYENWVKIKELYEASGNTNNMFYKRACEIVKTKKDPLDEFFRGKNESQDGSNKTRTPSHPERVSGDD